MIKVFVVYCALTFRSYMPASMTIIEALSYIMVTINSSVNFVIYYFLGESFRKELKKMAKESKEKFQKWCSTFT